VAITDYLSAVAIPPDGCLENFTLLGKLLDGDLCAVLIEIRDTSMVEGDALLPRIPAIRATLGDFVH
jgi:hypothetical protein